MAGESAFEVEGIIIEALSPKTYRAELANGHTLLAFIAGKAKPKPAGLSLGNKVKLRLSPYDLSTGRIMVETEST
jgi:translation initiation factor IF-1